MKKGLSIAESNEMHSRREDRMMRIAFLTIAALAIIFMFAREALLSDKRTHYNQECCY